MRLIKFFVLDRFSKKNFEKMEQKKVVREERKNERERERAYKKG